MFELRDGIGLAITGILGILWFDIRGIRKERTELKSTMYDEFYTKETHDLTCENVNLKQAKDIKEYIDIKFNDLKDFIKKNGN